MIVSPDKHRVPHLRDVCYCCTLIKSKSPGIGHAVGHCYPAACSTPTYRQPFLLVLMIPATQTPIIPRCRKLQKFCLTDLSPTCHRLFFFLVVAKCGLLRQRQAVANQQTNSTARARAGNLSHLAREICQPRRNSFQTKVHFR